MAPDRPHKLGRGRLAVEVLQALTRHGVLVVPGLLIYVEAQELEALGASVRPHEPPPPVDDLPFLLSVTDEPVEGTLPDERVTRRVIKMAMGDSTQAATDPERSRALLAAQDFFEMASSRGRFREALWQLPRLAGTPEVQDARAALNRYSWLHGQHVRPDGSIAGNEAALELDKALLEFELARERGFARLSTRRQRESKSQGARKGNAQRGADPRLIIEYAARLSADHCEPHKIAGAVAKQFHISPTRVRQILQGHGKTKAR